LQSWLNLTYQDSPKNSGDLALDDHKAGFPRVLQLEFSDRLECSCKAWWHVKKTDIISDLKFYFLFL
jgi:hypothetical protein